MVDYGFATFSHPATSMTSAVGVVARLINHSQWFVVTPLPDDLWDITVKVENKRLLMSIILEEER